MEVTESDLEAQRSTKAKSGFKGVKVTSSRKYQPQIWWPCVRADMDRRSTPLLCVLAGAVGPHCLVFGSLVRWMLAALHSCYVLLVDLCA